tara:strand:- start:273 stop:683 length:411 start_codon:yes stop_codon:yes gene_type:complete
MHKNLSRAVKKLPESQIEISRITGVNQSTLSRVRSGTRPSEDTLSSLCSSWAFPARGIPLLCGHLKDEVERAGFELHDVKIEPNKDRDHAAARHLATIAAAMENDEDLRALVENVAKVIENTIASLEPDRTHSIRG